MHCEICEKLLISPENPRPLAGKALKNISFKSKAFFSTNKKTHPPHNILP